MLEKNNMRSILEVFFEHPTKEFHVRELARKTGLSAPTIMTAIDSLKRGNLITTYKKGNMKIVKASESAKFTRAKRVRNIRCVYESGVIDYLNELYDKPAAIILFGSFSRGDDIERSDIDIAVVANLHEEPHLKEFEKKLGKHISIHEIDIKKVSREFYNNLTNGIVMEGAL